MADQMTSNTSLAPIHGHFPLPSTLEGTTDGYCNATTRITFTQKLGQALYGTPIEQQQPPPSVTSMVIPGMQVFHKICPSQHSNPSTEEYSPMAEDLSPIRSTCLSNSTTSMTPHSNSLPSLEAPFDTPSSNTIDLNSLIASTLNDLTSFSCDPSELYHSSPSSCHATVHLSSSKTSDEDSLPLFPLSSMDEDEETDTVPSELVQFVSESTQRIQAELAETASVCGSDLEELDHEAQLASLCLPILQPPSIVSSHASDDMRPPSLSPERDVSSPNEFEETDFTKAYFSDSADEAIYDKMTDPCSVQLPPQCYSSESGVFSDTSLGLGSAADASMPPSSVSPTPSFGTQTLSTATTIEDCQYAAVSDYPLTTQDQFTVHQTQPPAVSYPDHVGANTIDLTVPVIRSSPSMMMQPILTSTSRSEQHMSQSGIQVLDATNSVLRLGSLYTTGLSNPVSQTCINNGGQSTTGSPQVSFSSLSCKPSGSPSDVSRQVVQLQFGGSNTALLNNSGSNVTQRMCFAKSDDTRTVPNSLLTSCNPLLAQNGCRDETLLVFNQGSIAQQVTRVPSAIFSNCSTTGIAPMSVNPSISTCSSIPRNLAPIRPYFSFSNETLSLLKSSVNGTTPVSSFCTVRSSLVNGTTGQPATNGISFQNATGNVHLFTPQTAPLSTVRQTIDPSPSVQPISFVLPSAQTMTNGFDQRYGQSMAHSPSVPDIPANNLTLQILNSLATSHPGMSIMLNGKSISTNSAQIHSNTTATLLDTNCTSTTTLPTVTTTQINPLDSGKSRNSTVLLLNALMGSSMQYRPKLFSVPTVTQLAYQQRLGVMSSTPLLLMPDGSSGCQNPLNLTSGGGGTTCTAASVGMNGMSSVNLPLNTAMSVNPTTPTTMTTHLLLLRPSPTPKPNLIKPESTNPLGTHILNNNPGMTILMAQPAAHKLNPDPTQLLFIPSVGIGSSDTSLTLQPSNSIGQHVSVCNATSFTTTCGLNTSAAATATTPTTLLPTANPGLAYLHTGPMLDPSRHSLLTNGLPSFMHQSLPTNPTPLSSFPLTLFPGLNTQNIVLPSTWSSPMNLVSTQSSQYPTQTTAFLSPATTLSSGVSSSSCVSLDPGTLPSPPLSSASGSIEGVQMTNYTNTTSTMASPPYTLCSTVNQSSIVQCVSETITPSSVEDVQTVSRKSIVLPSADNLLSNRLAPMPSGLAAASSSTTTTHNSDCKYRRLTASCSSGVSNSTDEVTVTAVSSVNTASSTSSTSSGRRRHQCPYCPKSCERKDNLQAHIRTHTGERPYPCRFCPKAFPQKDHLRAHIRTHTGEKPYRCPQCLKSFAQLGNLHRHVKTHRS